MYQVDGFVFASREDARQAKKEADGIAYIREHTRLNNPEVVRKLYDKLLDEGLFQTEVGMGFLRELQQELCRDPHIEEKEIRPIPVPERNDTEAERERLKVRERVIRRRMEEEKKLAGNQNLRGRFRISLFFNIVCAAVIAGMFLITFVSGKSTTILNYKNKIIDEYEAWDQQLKSREDELSAWEAELEVREERLSAQQE